MNIVKIPAPKEPKRRVRIMPILIISILFISLLGWVMPLPAVEWQSSYSYKSRPETVSLSWPSYGESAVAAAGYGVLDTNGSQVPVPMASVTKAITALAILQKKPLAPADQGPTIQLSSADVALYNDYSARGGTVVAVSDDEQISQRQALQAMLLPSANNMADTLVIWAFGSMNNYTKYANDYLKSLSIENTVIADASGFSPKSVATAEDLALIGLKFMQNPVLREIAAQRTADVPVAGKIFNTNWLLGTDGVIGIKTGNTDEAGGCYLFAATREIHKQPITVVGAVMGAPDRNAAITDSQVLMRSVDQGFAIATAVKKGSVVGRYVTDWGNDTNVVATKDVSVLTWKTRQAAASVKTVIKTPIAKGEKVGTLTESAWDQKATTDLTASETMNSPSWQWRLYKRYL
jgi:serine-type D-Ala-D-Ala carboxypeptidase (penicillin-binding protein 5/6)